MSNNFVEDGAFVNSIVGEGTRLKGELDLNGLLRIDGDFIGTIRTTGKVLIGKNGRAECTISASTVVVGGAVRGDIYSTEKVIILSSGIMLGNIYTPRLIVEEGVIFDGNCYINSNFGVNKELSENSAESEPSVSSSPETTEESSVPAAHESLESDQTSSIQAQSSQTETDTAYGVQSHELENVTKTLL